MIAVEKDRLDLVRLLVERGAWIDAKGINYGGRALMWAAEKGHVDLVSRFLEMDIDPNACDMCDCPISLAIRNGHVEVVKVLLDKGVELNPKNRSWAPLDHALESGHTEIIRLILKRGPNIDRKDNQDLTPLQRLVERNRANALELAKLLIEKGANVNAAMPDGRTSLMFAVKAHNINMVRLFVEKGADVNAMDKKGLTALRLAEAHKQDAMAQYLKENGAK